MPSFSNWRVFFFALFISALFAASSFYIGYKIDEMKEEVTESIQYKMGQGG